MADFTSRWPAAAWACAAGVVGAILGTALGEPYRIGMSALLAACMAAIALEDARRLRVPDSWNLVAALAGLAAAWLSAKAESSEPLTMMAGAVLQALVCGGAFLLLREAYFRLRGVEGLGLGDVKLAATAGIWLGWQLFAVAVMLAAFAALAWVAAEVAIKRSWPQQRRIPLGAFLAPAIFACWYGAELVPLN